MKHLLFYFLMFRVAVCVAQTPASFAKVDAWLEANTPDMGRKSMLIVEKDGKILYSRGIGYDSQSRVPIASCSKWLSAALVMTYVDEGKLRLGDTVGTWLPALTENGKGGITVR